MSRPAAWRRLRQCREADRPRAAPWRLVSFRRARPIVPPTGGPAPASKCHSLSAFGEKNCRSWEKRISKDSWPREKKNQGKRARAAGGSFGGRVGGRAEGWAERGGAERGLGGNGCARVGGSLGSAWRVEAGRAGLRREVGRRMREQPMDKRKQAKPIKNSTGRGSG